MAQATILGGLQPVHTPELLRQYTHATWLCASAATPADWPPDQVARVDAHLHALLSQALRPVHATERIVHTETGCVGVALLGDPTLALECTRLLRDLAQRRHRDRLPLRIGLHFGAGRVVPVGSLSARLVGHGIETARVAMQYAEGGDVMLTGAYQQVFSALSPGGGGTLVYRGTRWDRNMLPTEVYGLSEISAAEVAAPPTASGDVNSTWSRLFARTLSGNSSTPADIRLQRAIVSELVPLLGRVAEAIVRKAAQLARDETDLRERCGRAIADTQQRIAFVTRRAPLAV